MKKMTFLLMVALLLPSMASAWDRAYQPTHMGRVNFSRTTSIEALGWRTNFDGDLRIANPGAADFTLDFDSEGNFSDETRYGFRISHVLSEKSALKLSYMSLDNSGTFSKSAVFDFQGVTYDANATINMDVKKHWFDLTYMYNLNHGREAVGNRDAFYLDALVGVKFNKAEVDVAGASGGVVAQSSWDESFPVPYIGLAAASQVADNLWLKGQVKYININFSGNDAKHHDYSLNLAYRINSEINDTEWYVDVGYRGIKYDVETDDDRAELSYCGPTFGVFARF